MISVSGLFTEWNTYFSHLFMLSLQYTGTFYYHFSCSLNWTVLTKIFFSDGVVTICSCINFSHISVN